MPWISLVVFAGLAPEGVYERILMPMKLGPNAACAVMVIAYPQAVLEDEALSVTSGP